MPEPVRVFTARRILTMNPAQPEATHVAIRNGRILAVGGPAEMADLGPAETDDRFAAATLLPGFVEGHSHFFEGAAWRDPYVGFFDRRAPDGSTVPGLKTLEAVIARLRDLAAGGGENRAPLTAWGFDPIYFGGRRMTAADLDRVAADRPIVVSHASGHIMNANSAALRQARLADDTDLDGLVRDGHGKITGELLGPEAMGHMRREVLADNAARRVDAEAIRSFAAIARRVGVTTATPGQRHVPGDRRRLSRRQRRAGFSATPGARFGRAPVRHRGRHRPLAGAVRPEHRAAAFRPGQAGGGRLHPGLHRPAALARLP